MTLKKGIDMTSFLQAVKSCRENVYFVTAEGDNLNLKSSLAQFVFAAVLSGQLQKPEGQIRCDATDLPLLEPFLQ